MSSYKLSRPILHYPQPTACVLCTFSRSDNLEMFCFGLILVIFNNLSPHCAFKHSMAKVFTKCNIHVAIKSECTQEKENEEGKDHQDRVLEFD